MDSRRKVLLMIIGGVTLLFVVISLTYLLRRDSNQSFATSSSPAVNLTPGRSDSLKDHHDSGLTQSLAVPEDRPVLEEKEVSLAPPRAGIPPALDESSKQKIKAAFNAKIRAETRALYGEAFQQLHLSADLQNKVLDILTQPENQLQQQAIEAAQTGTIPVALSPEALRAQQVQQDQQLRSVLGDSEFAQFSQYRATIPDRIIMNDMNQQGGNLRESQSAQLLQVLTEARQQIIGQADTTRNLGSMSPDQATTIMQQQQALLEQTVSNRIQNILTPEQQTTFREVFSRYGLKQR
jgi:hypothetical protein